LTGLTADTQYFYRVRSQDGAGNLALLTGLFRTAPAAPPPPPPPPGGIPLTGLKLWLKSDEGLVVNGSSITQWSDSSGAGTHATQPDPARRPIRAPNALAGKPVVRFDGFNDFLSFTLPVNGWSAMTMVVVNANASNYDGSIFGSYHASLFWTPLAGSTGDSVYLTPLRTEVQFRFGNGQPPPDRPIYRRPISLGAAFSITMATKDSGTETIHVNRNEVLRLTGRRPVLAGIAGTAFLGKGANNVVFGGDIAEVIVYDRALSDAEKLQVQNHLLTKYLLLP
jgi:hypothetical protein